MGLRRWIGTGLFFVGGFVGVGLVGAVAFGWWVTTPTGNHWLKRTIETGVRSSMAKGSFEIDTLRTDLLWSLDVEGLRIVDDLGTPLVEIPAAQARYDVTSLLTGPLNVHTLDVQGLRLLLDSGDERLRLAELFGPASDSTEPFSLPIDVDVPAVTLSGTTLLIDESLRLEGGDLVSSLTARGPVFSLPDARLCAHLVVPGPLPVCAQGPFTWNGTAALVDGLAVDAPGTALVLEGSLGSTMDLTILAGRVDLEALDPLANRTGLRGVLGGDATLTGALDALVIKARLAGLEGTAGALVVDGYASMADTITWGGTVQALGVDVAGLYDGTPMPVVLDGTLVLGATGVKYPDDLLLDLHYSGRVDADDTYHLRDTVFDGTIDQGILQLTRGDFDGVAGPLGATGSIDLVAGPMKLDVGGTLSSTQLADLGIEGLGPDGRADLVLTSNLKQDAGRFGLGGTVTWAPFSYTPDVTMDRLVARVSGSTVGGTFDVNVDVEGTGLDAYGVTADTLTGTALDVKRTAQGLTVDGPLAFTPLTLPGVGTFASASVQLGVDLPTTGERAIDAFADLGPFDLATFLGTGGGADLQIRGDDVLFDVALDDGARPFLRTGGVYGLVDQHLHTSHFDVAPTPRLAWTSSGPVDLQLTDGGIRDATVRLRGLHGDVDVRGSLGTTGAVDGEIRVIGLQLDALAELFPDAFNGLSGRLTLDATVVGDAANPDLAGRFDAEGVWIEDTARWLDAEGYFVGHDGLLELDALLGRAGDPLGKVFGTVPVLLDLASPGLNADGKVNLDLSVLPGSLARLEDVTVAELGLPVGVLSGNVGLRGPIRDPRVHVAGIVESAVGEWREPGRLEVDVVREGDVLSGRVDLLEGLARRVRVDGDGKTRMKEFFSSIVGDGDAVDTSDLNLWWDDITVTASADGMPVGSVASAGGAQIPVDGAVSGAVVITGDPYLPVVNGEMRWTGGSVGDVPVELADLLVRPAPNGLEVRMEADFDVEQRLLVEGTVPVVVDLHEDAASWVEGPLDLRIEGQDLPLGVAAVVEGVSAVKGSLDVMGSIGGTFADPNLDLTAGIRSGSFHYEPLGLAFSRMEASLVGRGRRLKLENLSARTLPLNPIGLLDENRASILRTTGTANLDRGALAELSGVVRLNDAWVMGTYDTALRMDGDVRLSGAWPALNVDGDLALANGRYVYRADDAVAASPLQPVEQLVIHRNGNPFIFRKSEEAAIYEAFDIDLGIDLKRNLEVVAVTPFFDDLGQLTASLTQANVNSRVGGKLKVGLNDDASFRVGGELDVLDGTIQVLRTKFRLDSGRVVLVPDDISASPLDLSATSHLSDATIDLRIAGTVGSPSLTTTSEGHDETQVLVMLLTGRSVKGLTSNQGQAASQDAALAAAALITSSVFSGAAAGALSIEADGSVRVGAPWSSSVFSELVLRPFADSDENLVSLAIEWALIRQLLLDAGAGDRYQWADLSWETRF